MLYFATQYETRAVIGPSHIRIELWQCNLVTNEMVILCSSIDTEYLRQYECGYRNNIDSTNIWLLYLDILCLNSGLHSRFNELSLIHI